MRRILITLGISTVFLAVGLGVVPALFTKKTTTNTKSVQNVNSTVQTNSPTTTLTNTNTGTPITDEKLVSNVAITFAERYGSFSSQNPNQNLIDASSLMTERLRRLTLAGLRVTPVSKTYEGTTTRAVAVKIDTLTPGLRARVLVTTSRQDFRAGRTDLPLYRQDLSLTFQSENGSWLVDTTAWLARGSE